MEPAEYERIAEAEGSHWWYVATRGLLADLLGPFLRSGQRILDAGCGPGGNGAWLASHGRVVGVDVSADALRFVRARRSEIVPAFASITELPFRSESFDAAIEVTVLNQVEEDARAVAELARVVRPGGAVVLFEPAFPALRRAHDAVVHARRRYRRRQLVGLAEGAGLVVERATYAHASLLPAAALLAGADRIRPRPPSEATSDLDRPAALDTVFSRLARVERRFLVRRSLPVGVSVVVLATK